MGRHCTIVQMLFKLPSDAQLVQFGRGILLNIVLLESSCVERLVCGGVCLVGRCLCLLIICVAINT